MRKPRCWNDKSLLEDEPFLSAFKARELAAPPTRRGTGPTGEDARNEAIADEILEMKLLTTVQTWFNLAFYPSYWVPESHVNRKMICLFVKFYWALSHNYDDAVGILQAAHKERGYGYFVHPNQTSPIGADADSIPCDIEFQEHLNAKKVMPDCPEQEGKGFSQTCSPSLDATLSSVTREIESKPYSALPLPPDSRNTTAIYDLPKKRKKRQIKPDMGRIKHRKFNEATSDASKFSNVSQVRNDVIDEKTKVRPSQREDIIDKADHVSNGALCGQLPSKKVPSRIPPSLKFNRNSAKKDVPDCPEGEAKFSSQTCPPSLYPTSLLTRKIESVPSTSPLPPDSQNTSDLPRQTGPDTPRRINESASDASKLGDNNIIAFQSRADQFSQPEVEDKATVIVRPVASFTSESTRIELDETLPSNAPMPRIHDPQRGDEAHPAQGKQKSRSNFRATKKTSVLAPLPKDATRQPKQYETTSNPKKRRASNSEGHQRKRQEVPVDQEDSIPVIIQPDLAKKKRGRPPKVKEGQEGSTSGSVQPARRKKKGQPLKSQTQLNAATVVPFSGQNVDMTHETSITPWIPLSLAQSSHAVSGLQQETVEGFSHLDHVPCSMLDRSMKEESEDMKRSENWLLPQEHVFVEEDFILKDPAATQMEDCPPATDIFHTHKPPLCVNPPIWAQSRQEVCETLDWFRSYQGGVYFAHNAVKGYLLSAFSSKRDRFEHDGKLIISHGGGKSESLHTRKGQTTTQPATDQLAQDKSICALLDNYRNQRPLALLIDDKYALFPYDLGFKDLTYVVLGFYTIAHAWAEFQGTNEDRVVRYKFAFRWCDDQGSPWWLTEKETNLSDLPPPSIPTSFSSEPTSKRKPRKLLNRDVKESENDEGAALHTTMVQEAVSHGPKSYVCRICHMDSPHVYTWAWLCLHPDCLGFWKDIKGNFAPDDLEYDLDFLKLMTSLPVPPDFGKLKPDPPPRLSTDGTVTSYAFTRGFHCNSCGRLSCRIKWEKWECSNCKESVPVSRPPHKAKDFWSYSLPIAYKDHFISKKSKIEQQPVRSFTHENGMGSIQSFILPDGRGMIHHIQPGTPLGRLEADDIFIEYQQQATSGELKFRRWPLRSHKCRGALLTNYFSQNCGEPYQYVGGTANTVPFENAPGAVVKARALIQKRVQQALGTHVEFNEILSAAYMERQKMAFHSDNEIGLGPVVAGLSLGSPALMHFRINPKYDRLRELKGSLLSFVLRHGDVLVMDGASVQEYYEHTVIPNNFRIAATARYITPGHA